MNTVPQSYSKLVNQKEYEFILACSIQEIEKLGRIVSIEDGVITAKDLQDEDQEMKIYLGNLIKKCKQETTEEWIKIIGDHFGRLQINKSKSKYIHKDIDFAQNLIKVQVRMFDTMSDISLDELVCREDMPGTYTFLVLDFDERFHFIRKDGIAEWEKSIDELFEIGFDNVVREKINVKEYTLKEDIEMFSFFDGDFSASYVIQLERNAPYAIGTFGSVVTIPSKGVALVHPINGETALDFISTVIDTQQAFYRQDPVPITDTFYWFYESKFYPFAEMEKDGKDYITYPKEFWQMIEKLDAQRGQ